MSWKHALATELEALPMANTKIARAIIEELRGEWSLDPDYAVTLTGRWKSACRQGEKRAWSLKKNQLARSHGWDAFKYAAEAIRVNAWHEDFRASEVLADAVKWEVKMARRYITKSLEALEGK